MLAQVLHLALTTIQLCSFSLQLFLALEQFSLSQGMFLCDLCVSWMFLCWLHYCWLGVGYIRHFHTAWWRRARVGERVVFIKSRWHISCHLCDRWVLERVVEIRIRKRVAVKIRHCPGTARHPPEPGAETQTRRGRRPPARSRRRRRRTVPCELIPPHSASGAAVFVTRLSRRRREPKLAAK